MNAAEKAKQMVWQHFRFAFQAYPWAETRSVFLQLISRKITAQLPMHLSILNSATATISDQIVRSQNQNPTSVCRHSILIHQKLNTNEIFQKYLFSNYKRHLTKFFSSCSFPNSYSYKHTCNCLCVLQYSSNADWTLSCIVSTRMTSFSPRQSAKNV